MDMMQTGSQSAVKGFSGAIDIAAVNANENASRVEFKEAGSQIKAMELEATQREADRKDALNKALASQNAMVGAKGIGFGGSSTDIMEQDIQTEKLATNRDRFMTDLNKKTTYEKARLKRKMEKGQKSMGVMKAFANYKS